MLSISLPELPKPSRTSENSQKAVIWNPKCYIENKDKIPIIPINPFKGPHQEGGNFCSTTRYDFTVFLFLYEMLKA